MLDLVVEHRSLRTPRRIENEESAGGVEHRPERVEQGVLLGLGEMAEQEADERRVVRALLEFMLEESSPQEDATVDDPEPVHLGPGLHQHPV